MCRFCVEHGEGERWYLRSENYAHDLQSDLKRRGYVVDFIRNFESKRSNAITAIDVLEKMPGPLERLGKAAISKRMQSVHFGQPLPIEDCAKVFDLATSITVIPCICRMHARGSSADEVCVLVTTQPIEAVLAEGFADYADGPDLSDFHKVDKAEALRLLVDCEHKGLMHSIWTFHTPFTAAICNCNVESGCMAMRLTVTSRMKMMWRGEYVADFDPERCTGCGKCAKLCPFDAISLDGVSAASRTLGTRGHLAGPTAHDACWGCGICRSACAAGAIRLADRSSVAEVAGVW
ncbi:MAG: 4Fe-4S binding protein [Coriobacteriales bacterium]|nr:4Fe-4S binding protein [Coriobacteriales bacterium]